MNSETITIHNNMSPPVVNGDTAKQVYDVVRTDEFDVAVFNGLLMAVVTYLDTHMEGTYADAGLPWAESLGADN